MPGRERRRQLLPPVLGELPDQHIIERAGALREPRQELEPPAPASEQAIGAREQLRQRIGLELGPCGLVEPAARAGQSQALELPDANLEASISSWASDSGVPPLACERHSETCSRHSW